MSPQVARIFELLNLDAVLESADVLAEALSGFGSPIPGGFACESLRARLEPFGRRGRASWLRVEGTLAAASGEALAVWLANENRAPLLLIDARAIAAATADGWSALSLYAARAAGDGVQHAVIGAALEVAPAASLGLPVFDTLAAALRAQQLSPPLGCTRYLQSEFERDAELRAMGWNGYVELLHSSHREEHAA
jgi:hypothetical protein